jgi:predicted transcriptional regulator
MAAATIKEALHHLADTLPEDATWKDVAYEAYVRQEMEAGLAEAKRGEFADESDVKNTFARWGVQVEG